jgi:hypothetical protein
MLTRLKPGCAKHSLPTKTTSAGALSNSTRRETAMGVLRGQIMKPGEGRADPKLVAGRSQDWACRIGAVLLHTYAALWLGRGGCTPTYRFTPRSFSFSTEDQLKHGDSSGPSRSMRCCAWVATMLKWDTGNPDRHIPA